MSKVLKRSPHYGQHVAHGAKNFFDFAGWEMPEHFSSMDEEVQACRSAAVLFDGHAMGEVYVRGPDAHDAVQKLCAADIEPEPGRCFYSSLCNEKGGIVDDLVVFCIAPDDFLLTVAAFNTHKSPQWIEKHIAGMNAWMVDLSPGVTCLEVQGPKSRAILADVADFDVSNEALPYFRFVKGRVAGFDALVARLGVTGEIGYEIFYDQGYAWHMYDALCKAGVDHGLALCGNRTVGMFRLEKVYHIYTREIDEETNLFEAGLERTIGWEKGDFIGRGALVKVKERGPKRRLVGYIIDSGPVVVTPGTPIEANGEAVGKATFAAHSPTLKKVIGLGYVPVDLTTLGTSLDIVTDSGKLPASVCETPFFDPGGARIRV